VIVLNPKEDELEAMELALLEKQARILAEKKEKKKSKASKKDLDGTESSKSSSKRKLDSGEESSSKHKKQHLAASNYPSPPPTLPVMSSTHSLTAAVAAKVAEQMAVNASRKTSSAIQSLYNTGKVHRENFMNR